MINNISYSDRDKNMTDRDKNYRDKTKTAAPPPTISAAMAMAIQTNNGMGGMGETLRICGSVKVKVDD